MIAHSAVSIPVGNMILQGDLSLPRDPKGMVLFAHGSGSSRYSPRNRYVAEFLNEHSFGALLADLLTAEEERADAISGHLRFDIGLLKTRLTAIADWVASQSSVKQYPLGLFGASTGAAAALFTAAERPEHVKAIVSRGGRPDLAQDALSRVRAPTLLIVGGQDRTVIKLNRAAMAVMTCEVELSIVSGATHLFEERGTLAQVASLASDWFTAHLAAQHEPVRSSP